MAETGLPGLRGAEHVGITVPDMEQAVRFFVDVLGCRFVLDGGEVHDPRLNRTQLDVAPAARMRWCFLRCGHGPNIELFQYWTDHQTKVPPRNSDVGGHHIALYVDDMAGAVAHLRGHGVPVSDPERITQGPAAGSAWTYFRTPWGLQMELCSAPDGKGPAGGPARTLWHPADPSR